MPLNGYEVLAVNLARLNFAHICFKDKNQFFNRTIFFLNLQIFHGLFYKTHASTAASELREKQFCNLTFQNFRENYEKSRLENAH